MTKIQVFYLLFLLCSWTVDLSHWHEWGVLDEKYGHEVVQRKMARATRRRVATAIKLIAEKLLTLIQKIFK